MSFASWLLSSPGWPAHDDRWYYGGSSPVGGPLSAESALRSSAVYGCVRLIGGTLASLPLPVFRRLSPSGKQREPMHPVARLLRTPNRWQTGMEWREMMNGHLLLRGNAFSEKRMTTGGVITELVPLHPGLVKPEQVTDGSIRYQVRDPETSKDRTLSQDEVFHLRLQSNDGVVGLSPVDQFRTGIYTTLASQNYTAEFYQNSAIPGGVLTSDLDINPDKAKDIKKRWEEAHLASLGNSHGIGVLGSGLKWQHVGMTHENAQFLEIIKATDRQISGHIYGVPPHMLGDTEASTSWGTGIEQQGIGFVTYTLSVHGSRWNYTAYRDLFFEDEREEFFIDHVYEALLRGDVKSRYEGYSKAVNSNDPWLTKNEIRGFENLNPVEGGDDFPGPPNRPAERDYGATLPPGKSNGETKESEVTA